MSNSNNNNLDYLNQLDLSLPLAPTYNIDGSLIETSGLDQFMDSSFFDFDALYNIPQFQSSHKPAFQTEFQQQINKIEESVIPDDFLQLIKSETKENQQIPSAISIETDTTPQANTSSPDTESPNTEGSCSDSKKKRNTAASARFRVKKKLKEQEMERTLRSLTERVQKYNTQIQQLEFENKCLKSLIFEKNERKGDDIIRSIRKRTLNQGQTF